MGLFKGLNDKPYTKADYYRELEARHAAKIAAKAAPVVVVPVKEPEWLEPEPVSEEPSAHVVEEVVVPFVEETAAAPVAEPEPVPETVSDTAPVEPNDIVTEVPEAPKEEKKSVSKQKRKKS